MFQEYATYLTENLFKCSQAPGPGNYNPIDNSVWNKIARDTTDKKPLPVPKKQEDDKKKEKKKDIKPTPGPGTYEYKTNFPMLERKEKPKEKKETDKDKKKKDEDHSVFGVKINKVPGPGSYDIKRELMSSQAKFTTGGGYNKGTGMIRRNIVTGRSAMF